MFRKQKKYFGIKFYGKEDGGVDVRFVFFPSIASVRHDPLLSRVFARVAAIAALSAGRLQEGGKK